MSRAQHDQVIEDDEAETCPLCIEDFDLSDRNFRPCPCGYQICQFCYNNIKTTMNGLCPACRRVYDDKNIQWKVPSAEEMASYKENVAQQARKKAVARQKEAQRREADSLSRKHLAGIRVRQKNLVYVTGMRPTGSPERLAEELRKPEYFGQYGKIVKVVVSKAKENHVGIYVTFESKDDARRCIESVDGSSNNENRLRAQYGTTKYCSAYLRGETCGNRSCMFLHEPGEENESFTRQDLSSMNVISTQSPQQANLGGQSSGLPLQPQPPPQQAPQYVAAASQANETQTHREGAGSPVDSSDGSALPSTASWAKMRPGGSTGGSSRRASQAQSAESPFTTNAVPTNHQEDEGGEAQEAEIHVQPESTKHEIEHHVRQQPSLRHLVHDAICSDDFCFNFDQSRFSKEDLDAMAAVPSFFESQGGPRRHLAEKQALERRKQALEHHSKSQQAVPGLDLDETAEGGSLQLGGEPEEHSNMTVDQLRRQQAIQSPTLSNSQALSPGPGSNLAAGRGLTAQQQQQLLLQQFKSASPNFLNQSSTASAPGHARQSSRFSFANDQNASATVKPVANPKLMSQQSSMMPPSTQYNAAPGNSQFFSSGVQGPPPGLKATGTPPVSGGGMFGQGHGFATAGLSYSMNAGNRNVNDEMMRELLRNRGGSAGSGNASDADRLDHLDPSIAQSRLHQTGYGAQAQSQDADQVPVSVAAHLLQEDLRTMSPFMSGVSSPHFSDTRRSTPVLPPGIPLPFSRAPPSLLEKEHVNVTAMPELGRIPSTATTQEEHPVQLSGSRPTSKSEPQNKSVIKPATSTDTQSDLAFPALPKPPVTAAAAAPKPKKTKTEPKQSASETTVDTAVKPSPSAVKGTLGQDMGKADGTQPSRQATARHPGKLDISVAQSSKQDASASATPSAITTETSVHGLQELSGTPSTSSRPGTPSQGDASVKRTVQPRTIRILGTPKNDVPASTSPVPSTVMTAVRPSRQASITSAAGPGTPISENNNDSLSVTDSMSRASSPPPVSSRVGSAPVRAKTKSQQKKERQERAKALEEMEKEEVDTVSTPDVVVQEPIMGRKKKTKAKKAPSVAKTTPASITAPVSAPVVSGPASPVSTMPETAKSVEAPASTAPAPKASPKQDTKQDNSAESVAAEPEAKQEETITPSAETDASKRLFLSDLVTSLEAAGPEDAAALADFFKPMVGMLNARFQEEAKDTSEPPLSPQPPLSPAEMAILDKGEPVRRSSPSGRLGSRLMVTPSTRKAVRSLSAELEDRLLALERSIRTTQAPLRYSHRTRSEAARHASYLVDEMLKDAAAALTRPPTTVSASAAAKKARAATAQKTKAARAASEQYSEATGKPVSAPAQPAYADDALAYLNQFILPLPSGRMRTPPLVGTEGTNPIATAIPRTYTTGDPTYSVSGVDVSSNINPADPVQLSKAVQNALPTASQSSLQAVAAAAMALNASSSSAGDLTATANAAAETIRTLGEGRNLAEVRREVLGVAAAISQQAQQAQAQFGHNPLHMHTQAFAQFQQAQNYLGYATAQLQGLSGYAGFNNVGEAEQAMFACKKECEVLEKKLMGLVRRNRKAAGIQ